METDKLMFYHSSLEELLLHRNDAQRFIDERCRIEDRDEIWKYFLANPKVGYAIASNYSLSNEERKEILIESFKEPKLHVVFGGVKGAGKTAFAFWIAEEIHKRTDCKVCLLRPLDFDPEVYPVSAGCDAVSFPNRQSGYRNV